MGMRQGDAGVEVASRSDAWSRCRSTRAMRCVVEVQVQQVEPVLLISAGLGYSTIVECWRCRSTGRCGCVVEVQGDAVAVAVDQGAPCSGCGRGGQRAVAFNSVEPTESTAVRYIWDFPTCAAAYWPCTGCRSVPSRWRWRSRSSRRRCGGDGVALKSTIFALLTGHPL